MSVDQFPSKGFMRKHFGCNLPMFRMFDVGLFSTRQHTEMKRHIQTALIYGPKQIMHACDKSENPLGEIKVFNQWKLYDTVDVLRIREVLTEQINPRVLSDCFERELHDEMVSLVTNHQPLAKDWWEWFADNGTIGIRLKDGYTPGGNTEKRSGSEYFQHL